MAGLTRTAAADSASLSSADAAGLQKSVAESGIYDLPPEPGAPPKHADRFQYSLTVEGDDVYRVTVNEEDCSPQLRSLIALVEHLSQSY